MECYVFVFFKQKTAYEMRISDWSSDVCSSDLKMAVSKAEDFMGDTHFMRILSDTNSPGDENTRRLVLCSGKVAYDLIEARDAAGDKNTQIVRIEQLYP